MKQLPMQELMPTFYQLLTKPNIHRLQIQGNKVTVTNPKTKQLIWTGAIKGNKVIIDCDDILLGSMFYTIKARNKCSYMFYRSSGKLNVIHSQIKWDVKELYQMYVGEKLETIEQITIDGDIKFVAGLDGRWRRMKVLRIK